MRDEERKKLLELLGRANTRLRAAVVAMNCDDMSNFEIYLDRYGEVMDLAKPLASKCGVALSEPKIEAFTAGSGSLH